MGNSHAPANHWFARQIQILESLRENYLEQRGLVIPGDYDSEMIERQARDAFLKQLRSIAHDVGERKGVMGCVVSHDGLALETFGEVPDHEAVAAMAQVCLAAGNQTATSLQFGNMGQLVVVGESHKLALFAVGDFAITVLAKVDQNLAESLA